MNRGCKTLFRDRVRASPLLDEPLPRPARNPQTVRDVVRALFSFPSLAAYEQYRGLFGEHPDFVAADRIRDESGCVLRYERSFMRPLLGDDVPGERGARRGCYSSR